MFWIENARYCKLWKVFEVTDKYADVSIGTSEKKQDDTWARSRWSARLIGHAFNQFKNGDVAEGETYTIAKAKLSNESYQDADGNWKNALRLIVMDFDLGEGAPAEKSTAKKTEVKTAAKSEPGSKSDLPW